MRKSTTASTDVWSPSAADRHNITFAKLLKWAAAPESEATGKRKRFLERQLFYGSEAAKAAYGERFYKAAQAVLAAVEAKDTRALRETSISLADLWEEYTAAKPTFKQKSRA